jgi:D-sorbitol dehydrogenase (acceptor)
VRGKPGRLAGKAAIVTGGAGGIGRAIAAALADAGAKVCTADIDIGAAEATAAGIGADAFACALDVLDAVSIGTLVQCVTDRCGRIDILVNAAGVFGLEPWLKVSEREFDRLFAINVRGLLFVSQAVAAIMVEQGGGSIVNIASASGRRGNPMSVVYSASKASVISLTQSAALAFARHGVRVNAIAPGGVLTPMWDEVDALYAGASGQAAGAMTGAMTEQIPLGRMFTPADQVGAALFLASDDSAYVTGQTLNVDGGLFLN